MKESSELAMGNQWRSITGRLGEIAYYADKRTVLLAVTYALTSELSHPCASPLACPREEISIEQCKMASVCISYIIYFHIFMINRHIVQFLEIDAVQPIGQPEHRVNAAFQLEIRLKLLLIYCIFSLLVTLWPEREIPRH